MADATPPVPAAPPRAALDETLGQEGDELERGRTLSEGDELPPATVPGFRIIRRLGEGKYGSVWLAREQNTGKQVAIKFYSTRRGVDWALLSREVEKLAVLYTSRNIVGLVAVGWDHDPPYYIMEYLENGSLGNLLANGPVRPAEAVRIALRIAKALIHAQSSGILHCDLKPANILLDKDLEPRLCDFGQSRLIDEHSHALGTLFYMAPEQADTKAIPDARWDVYALGAILYHMLTGSPPFRSPENEARLQIARSLDERLRVYQDIVEHAPKPAAHRQMPGVDPMLADIVDRCLAPHPSRRFPNAQAVWDQLTQRDRLRSRRPIIFLGLVLPVLLILSMAPLAWEAIRLAVTTAGTKLTARSLESDVVTASFLSQSVERELLDRFDELLRIARYERVRRTVAEYADKPAGERKELEELMLDLKIEVDDRHRVEQRKLDDSWFLTDARGYQRWREPPSDRSMEKNYAHRDYFHGRDEEYPPGGAPADIKPIRQPHLSTVYTSTTTGRYKVALSVPIWDLEDKQIIGVLARTMYLSELLVEYEDLLRDQQGDGISRVVSLLDSRDWKLLAHPWMSDENLAKLDVEDFSKLALTGAQAEQLTKLIGTSPDSPEFTQYDRTGTYVDPVSQFDEENYKGNWLAAFSPIRQTSWVAVVQERRRDVYHPVEEMRSRMLQYAWLALFVAGLVVLITWAIILRAFQDRRGQAGGGAFGLSPRLTESTLSLTNTGTQGERSA